MKTCLGLFHKFLFLTLLMLTMIMTDHDNNDGQKRASFLFYVLKGALFIWERME